MGRSSPPKLLLLFLLASLSIVCLHGSSVTGDYGLQCVTNYLYINCSLNLHTPSENTSYWLRLFETEIDGETFLCNLTNTSGISSCSTRKFADEDDSEILMDMYSFEISLCHKQHGENESCEMLDEGFQPVANIKPNAPCCLTMTHNSSQHRFTWRSTYEQYGDYTNLVNNFKYQLYFYKRGDHVMSHNISTGNTEYSVNDQVFVPDSEYAARVRSSPNQAFYRGQWSDWSSEVHWKTERAMDDPSTHTILSSLAKRVFTLVCLLCALVLLALLSCVAPVKKWKQSVFIPNPAPYFHTLYSNCQGDFRSWVVTQGNTADMSKAEETLQIDTLVKSADVQEEDCQAWCSHQLMEGSGYSNITDQMYDESLLGFPYTVSSTAPQSDPESSLKDVDVSVQSGNPAEGDSGCWLCSDMSLEKDPPWYCNDYCTLSSFQQLTLVTAEHIESLCTQGIKPLKALREA